MIVLMYHDVYSESISESGFTNSTASNYKISVKNFENQVKKIHELVVNGIIDKESIQFTFDDGGISFYSIIAPILEKYKFIGYYFITTSLIGKNKFISEELIMELNQRGHIIGAHSHTHPIGMKYLNKQELINEWYCSIETLKKILNKPIKYASIPGGSYSKKTIDVLIDLGIENIYTSKPTIKIRNYKNTNIFGRIGIKSNMSLYHINKIISSDLYRKKIATKKALLNIFKIIIGKNYFKIREIIYKK